MFKFHSRKRSVFVNLLCLFLLLAVLGTTVDAAGIQYYNGSRYVNYTGAKYTVYYEGKKISNSKVFGINVNGNLMIPYYKLMVKKCNIKYKKKKFKKKVTLKLSYWGNAVKLILNKKYMYIDGKYTSLRTAPFKARIYGKSMIMVPAKAVCKNLGLDYTYDLSKKTIHIGGGLVTKKVVRAFEEEKTTKDTGLQAASFKKMTQTQFINAVGKIAKEDYKKTGVLASVTIAQAINESGWGKSGLTQKSNNLFGMKTTISSNNWTDSTWDGKSYVSVKTREEYSGKMVTITAKFRKYGSVEDSISDHSAYLKNAKNGSAKRYAGLTGTKSYKKQLKILQKGGYCTWSGYVKELTNIIKTYDLTKWDK